MQKTNEIKQMSFDEILISKEAFSYFFKKLQELRASKSGYGAMTLSHCSVITCCNNDNNNNEKSDIIPSNNNNEGYYNSFAKLYSEDFPDDALFCVSDQTLKTAQDAKNMALNFCEMPLQEDTQVYEFRCTCSTIHMDALSYLLSLAGKEMDPAKPFHKVEFSYCTFCIPTLNSSEMLLPEFSFNAFKVNITGISTHSKLKIVPYLVQQANTVAKTNVVAFSECALPLYALQHMLCGVSVPSDNQCEGNYEAFKCYKKVILDNCTILSATRRYEFGGDMCIDCDNKSIEISNDFGPLNSECLNNLMELMAHHLPFSNITTLDLNDNKFKCGIITKYLNQTILKRLRLYTRSSEEVVSLFTTCKTNSTLMELDLSECLIPSRHDMMVLLDILKHNHNMTLKKVVVNSHEQIADIIKEINSYYLGLNQIRRDKLLKIELDPLLFPFVLENAENQSESSTYWVLRSFPDIFLSPHHYCQIKPKRKRQKQRQANS